MITYIENQVLAADDAGDDHVAGNLELQPDEFGGAEYWYFVPNGRRLTAKQLSLISDELSRRNRAS